MNAPADTARPAYPVHEEDGARADFYALLARIFYGGCDADLLRALAAAQPLAAGDAAAALPAAWDELRAAAAAADPAELRESYERLFIGVGKPDVMLYGSYYLAGFMMEKPLALLRGDLAALGLVRRSGVAEPEDHFAALADVMRHLILDEACLPRERAARQQRFFERHLAPWYARFLDALEAAAEPGFFGSAGRFARAFLDVEKASYAIEAQV